MGEPILLQEASSVAVSGIDADGTYPVTLLTPGLGASAFYSESVIKRDAPAAFPKGTHVYLTHERMAGGEPSPEKLLGVLVNDTTIRESDGAAVNRFKPIATRAEFVEAVHKHVGLSVSARGSATMGIIDGKQVKIAESIDYAINNTVDMVSYPGRAGSGFVESAFAQMVADVQPESSASGNKKNGNKMETDEKLDKLIESFSSLTTLIESALPKPASKDDMDAEADRKAAVAATRLVEAAKVPDSVKADLIESINGGNYEVEAEITKITSLRESLKAEVEAEFKESLSVGANGATGSGTDAVTVKGWGN